MVEKNKKKEQAKRNRAVFNMNLGERPHKSKKHPSRGDLKKSLRNELD